MHETPVLVSSRGEKVPFYAKRSSLMFRKQKPCLWAVSELRGTRKLIFYLLLALLSGCSGQGSTPRVFPRNTCSYVDSVLFFHKVI